MFECTLESVKDNNPIIAYRRKVKSNRRRRPSIACVLLTLLALAGPAFGSGGQAESRFAVELEAGPVWQGKNDVQIPNNVNGTRFSLVDVAGNGPWPAGRLYLTWNISPSHGLRLLAAPLSISETGTLPSAVRFEGTGFNPGVPAEATYRFNSWRLTYHYRFHEGTRWSGWIGFTAKIRDAKIELSQASLSAKKTDLGFVPLLHLRGLFRFSNRWRLVLDIDALAGGPGRAEDASVKLAADISRHWSAAAGYRTIEGGADVDAVYAFAWLHYAVMSVIYRF